MAVLEQTLVAQKSEIAQESTRPRRWNVDEYYRMAEVGILGPNERTELIEGEIYTMSPIGVPHAWTVNNAADALRDAFGRGNYFGVQSPIRLNNSSEPEPDLYVARGPKSNYLDHIPRPDELLLVVETSDSSLAFDQKSKSVVYAEAGISEYWILNIVDRRLEVFRDPAPAIGYATALILLEADVVSPLNAPNSVISVADLLPNLPLLRSDSPSSLKD